MVLIEMLIGGIIALVIGIILYILAKQTFMPPGGSTAAKIGGIILSIVGIVLIVLAVLLPLIPAY